MTADAGSNSQRGRVWRVELQRLADLIGGSVRLLHYALGTSKWSRIEHRPFSYIRINWRAKPLTTHQTIINLIAGTTTNTGLKVYAHLDETVYPTAVTVTNAQLAAVNLMRHELHGTGYTVDPRTRALIQS